LNAVRTESRQCRRYLLETVMCIRTDHRAASWSQKREMSRWPSEPGRRRRPRRRQRTTPQVNATIGTSLGTQFALGENRTTFVTATVVGHQVRDSPWFVPHSNRGRGLDAEGAGSSRLQTFADRAPNDGRR